MSDRRSRREAEIAEAAYRLLDEVGLAGTTVTAVARAARASNETLYRWYGDRTGLFAALVRRNADLIRAELDEGSETGLDGLARIGPKLLAMVTGPRAVALNRAAAADATGTLGAELSRGGREEIAPLIAARIAEAQDAGALGPAPAEEIAETWLALLIGDAQIRRATGAIDQPTPHQIAARAARALDQLQRLYPPSPHAAPLDPAAPSA